MRCVCTRQSCLVHNSRWVKRFYLVLFFTNSLLHSWSLACTRYITIKQQYLPYTNTNSPAIIPTYDRVLSAIGKVFQDIVEEYWSIGKSLQDLVKGQKRNTAQLVRIGTIVEWKWGLKEDLQGDRKESENKENRDEEEKSKDNPRESQEEIEKGTLLLTFC